MNALTLFGLVAVSLMLLCDAFDHKHRNVTLAFAVACALGSIYGFLQGAWPFGLVEGIWAGLKVYHWWKRGQNEDNS